MKGRSRVRWIARLAFALFGVAALVLLVRHVGLAELGRHLRAALPWMPLLLLLEALRIVCEAASLAAVCPADARKLPLSTWISSHLSANAALIVLPGGRAVSEAIKISAFTPAVGLPRAAALVTVQHAMTMLAISVVSAPCAVAAWLVAPGSMVAIAAVIQGVVCAVAAFALVLASRKATVPKFVANRIGTTADLARDFRAAAKSIPMVPAMSLAAKVANRALQIVQFGIMLIAVGVLATPGRAFVAETTSLVGSALGELSPAQAGATDAAFALAARTLAIPMAAAVALATVSRVVQLVWALIGVLVNVIVRPTRAASPTTA